MTWLPVYAAAVEGDDLALRGALQLGVGKSAATFALTRALLDRRPDAVLLFGVCGAYPERHLRGGTPLSVGSICLVGEDGFADEGLALPTGFRDVAEMGLGEVGPFASDPERTARGAQVLGGVAVVQGATVSTCSGSDAISAAVASRSGAQVETMEGAAVALVCRGLGIPLVHVRCVSNLCGDRDEGQWDLPMAAARAREATLRLLHAFDD